MISKAVLRKRLIQIFLTIYLQSRLKPGRMLLVDTELKTLIQDVELKTKISKSRPYGEWLKQQVIFCPKAPPFSHQKPHFVEKLLDI